MIAQTHRDPVDLVGSYCSTYEQSRRRGCRAVDPVALGRERQRGRARIGRQLQRGGCAARWALAAALLDLVMVGEPGQHRLVTRTV
ncbi:MAG TPA: hypothetical protein PLO00_11145, partial [Usitatibacteraceae bacterium]|nr:hypothetical protein [Usitatibacteraceae bacterium]